MLNWLMGNLCDKSDSETAPQEAIDIASTTASNNARPLVHTAAVNCLASVGSILLSGCKDGNLALFDCAGRLLLARQQGAHEREVTAVAAANGAAAHLHLRQQLCASASRDKSLRLWLPPRAEEGGCGDDGRQLAPAGSFSDAHDLVVSAVAFNALDCNQVVSGSRDNSVKLWDASAQTQISSASVSRNLVTHIKWIPNSHQFLQASEDKELKLWDSRTMKVMSVFPRKQYIQTCCDVSSNGEQCVSSSNGFGGNGCEATVWDMRSKKPLLELIGHSESVLSVCYHGSFVLTGSADSTLRLWDPATGVELANLPMDGSGPISSVCSLPDLGLVGAATFNKGVSLSLVTNGGLTMSHRY